MRSEFPIFTKHPDLIYLDSAATAHKPACVIESLRRFYAEDYATVHRSIYRSSLVATEQYNGARETVRRFVNAKSADEIIFTRGTTDSINLVALSWGAHLKPGDEILVSEMEHHSNLVPWQLLAKKTGARLRWIPMKDDGVLDLEGAIRPGVKLVAIGHISNVTGTVNPIAEIVKQAHKVGAVVVVDGAQAAPHQMIDVQALGCDFYAFSGHKCYGPTGIGVLYGKKDLLDAMPPVMGGGDMIETVTLEHTTFARPPLRFEAGTPIISGVIGLKSALEWMESVGLSKIASQETALRHHLEKNLQTIDGLLILGTAPEKGPLCTFSIDGVHPLDLASWLDIKNIAIRSGHLCAQPTLRKFGLTAAARVSFGVYNTIAEVDLFCDVLQKFCQSYSK
ncbi:MAG TPA: SufS family cysteine desulfurase [Chlamydiales bacterium]|jgi:cysteine desulfurase/selenocysteine lyase|nr:SufS family cysteine desulfurase [Chlamydiales bacterium]